jgi:hypothetical protein
MDEKKLQALFQDAVPDAPPPSFGLGEVRAESGAQRTRYRNLLLGGSALGIVILTGATVLGVALWKSTDRQDAATAASAPGFEASSGNSGNRSSDLSHEDQSPQAPAAGGGGQQKSFPPESPKQGGTPTGNAGPQGPGSTLQGCGQADRELAAALAGELPAAASNDLLAATVTCPYGSRAFAVQVTDDGRTGLVTVVLTPVDGKVDYPVTGSPQGTVVGTGNVKGGKRVYVITEPTGGSTQAPLDTKVQDIADHAAAKFSG